MDQPGKERPQGDQEADQPAHGLPSVYWIIFLFAAYLLALGRAAKLHRAVPKARHAIEAIYFWVSPLVNASPTFTKAVRWYTEKLWGVK